MKKRTILIVGCLFVGIFLMIFGYNLSNQNINNISNNKNFILLTEHPSNIGGISINDNTTFYISIYNKTMTFKYYNNTHKTFELKEHNNTIFSIILSNNQSDEMKEFFAEMVDALINYQTPTYDNVNDKIDNVHMIFDDVDWYHTNDNHLLYYDKQFDMYIMPV